MAEERDWPQWLSRLAQTACANKPVDELKCCEPGAQSVTGRCIIILQPITKESTALMTITVFFLREKIHRRDHKHGGTARVSPDLCLPLSDSSGNQITPIEDFKLPYHWFETPIIQFGHRVVSFLALSFFRCPIIKLKRLSFE